MIRIALVAPTTLPSRRANTIQVMKMAQAIADSGRRIRLIAPRPPANEWKVPDWPDLARHYGLHRDFPIDWIPADPSRRGYDFGLSAVRQARAQNADFLYTRHPQAAAIAARSGLPAILEIHDLPQGAAGPLLFRLFSGGRSARRLVSISAALLADIQRRFSLPESLSTLVAADGVDLERYDGLPDPPAARAALGLPERFTAGYTGHLYEGRGIGLILELAARLPEFNFLLAGGSPEEIAQLRAKAAAELPQAAARNSLQTADVLADEIGLPPNLTLAGFVPNADLPRWQAACDVLLMPYQLKVAASSGGDIAPYLSPMKLFEYLACGRAILSSDLPVLREVLDERCSVLLPPDDPGAWELALQGLQADPVRGAALSASARERAGRYTWAARVEKLFGGLE